LGSFRKISFDLQSVDGKVLMVNFSAHSCSGFHRSRVPSLPPFRVQGCCA
jgi:hypothetical protein